MVEKSKLTIVTHNGKFHPDDVCAVATLFLVFEQSHILEVVRTRDAEKVQSADIVLDVGGIYDVEKNRFDHHQKGGAGIRETGVPYASFGLVWKKFGSVVSGSNSVAEILDTTLVQSIDAHDNGQYISRPLNKEVDEYTISDVLFSYNPTWKEKSEPHDLLERFLHAVSVAREIIVREVIRAKDKESADGIVRELYERAQDKRLVIFDRYYPWHSVLRIYPDTRLVIFPKLEGHDFVVEVVRDEDNFVNSRISFPESWAGKRDKELEQITGVSGSVFCHNGRFMVVARTKEAALALAHKTLEQ